METMIHILLLSGVCLFIQSISCEYILIQQQKTWDDARAYCRLNHLDLATVQSTEDWTNVQTAVGASLTTVAWIGLYNDIYTWRWSNQEEPLTLIEWFFGEPNNRDGIQDCGGVLSGTWHDLVCSEARPFVCYNENQVGANRFVLVTSPLMSWPDAQTYCRQHHTDLATIRTPAENDQVTSMTDSYPYIWIGLFRDSWKWSDGTTFSTSSVTWMPSFGDVTDQDRPCGVVSTDGRMDDELCSSLNHFICKLRVERKRQILRLEVKSMKNVNGCVVMGKILEFIKQKLKDRGIEKDTTLTWRIQPDENVFTQIPEIQ